MLKTSFSPILSTFPINHPISRFRIFSESSTSGIFAQHPPPVCQNVPPTIPLPPALSHPTSAYIHLPFCRKRCYYCDFPIIALGSSPSPHQQVQDPAGADLRISNYIQLLCREIHATRPKFPTNPALKTVFFGGGTPSLVPPTFVSLILEALRSKFGICPDAEISMEMDPGTFDAEKMRHLKDLGVNRVSLGVQAFQEEMLKLCGRAHGMREVYEAVEIIGSCGIENWSVDLISSLPHQTQEIWEESLALAVKAGPTHVSVYDLQVEQGTKFGQWYTPGEFPLPSEKQSAIFYKVASEMLKNAGYYHYEISSYCKKGYECKHNLAYWQNKSFYGFGLGSASFINGVRFSRPRNLKGFIEYVQKLEDGLMECEHGIGNDNNHIDVKDMVMDVVMLSLRMARGLDVKEFGRAFGESFVHSICGALKPYVESGHVIALDEKRRPLNACEFSSLLSTAFDNEHPLAFIRLSDPDGFLLSNELISIVFGAISP